jgi:hypothetical protein
MADDQAKSGLIEDYINARIENGISRLDSALGDGMEAKAWYIAGGINALVELRMYIKRLARMADEDSRRNTA